MPIITEPYSNPKWGFLHGLNGDGSNAYDTPQEQVKWLTAQTRALQISIEDLTRTRNKLIAVPIPADKVSLIGGDMVDKATIYAAAVESVSGLIEENVNLRGYVSGELYRELQRKVRVDRGNAQVYLKIAENFRKTGYLWGVTSNGIDNPASISENTRQSMANIVFFYEVMMRDLQLLFLGQQDSLSGGPVYNLLPFTTETFGKAIYRVVVKVLGAAESMANGAAGILQLIGKGVETGGAAASWLADHMGVVIAGAALVFLGPPLWRIFKTGREKGWSAGVDESFATIERGKEAAASAARKASTLATKAAAAYASGGASLAISGAPRRRRRSK